jgi:SAM-dependent methyltransferase
MTAASPVVPALPDGGRIGDEGDGADAIDGRFFEAIAEHADSAYLRYSFTKGTAQEMAVLWDALDLAPGMRVLDVGCGPGRHVEALSARGVQVVGVDISSAFLHLLPSGWPVRADVRRLPVRPGSFDAAICLCQGGFGLLGGADDEVVLAELAELIRPEGRIAVTAFSAYFAVRYLEDGDRFDSATGVNHERTDVRSPAGEVRQFDLWTTCFTPRELRLMARAAGLRPLGLWSVGPGDYAVRPPDLDHPEFLLVATREPGSTMPVAT